MVVLSKFTLFPLRSLSPLLSQCIRKHYRQFVHDVWDQCSERIGGDNNIQPPQGRLWESCTGLPIGQWQNPWFPVHSRRDFVRHVFPSLRLDYWFVLTCFHRDNDFSVVSVSQCNYLSAKSSNHCELKAFIYWISGRIGFCALIFWGSRLIWYSENPHLDQSRSEKKKNTVIFLTMMPMWQSFQTIFTRLQEKAQRCPLQTSLGF